MDLKDIRYVIAVAEEESFSKAAHKLYVSQPALSICIQRLEKELNAKLFIRAKNKVVPTPLGKLFWEEGSRLLKMSQEMRQRINDAINFEQGFIRVGVSQFYGRYYSPQLFHEFQQYYPGIRIEIVEDFSNNLEDFVAQGELDLCIIPSPVYTDSVTHVPLFQEQIYFAMSKEIRLSEMIPPSFSDNLPMIDLALAKDLPFVMLKKHQKIRKISEVMCHDAGFSPNIIFETQDLNTINNFISLNMGVGFVPDIIEKKSDVKDKINYYQIKSDKATRTFVIAYKKGVDLSKASEHFIRLAQDNFRSRTRGV